MNIIDYKSQIDSLTSNLVKEYNKLEKQYINAQKTSFNDLNDINNVNSSITDCLEGKIDAINSLEKQVLTLKKKEDEHISTIKGLQDKLDESLVEEDQTNKFDMLRVQSKEIVAKDKEIERLQKLLAKYKKDPDIKLNIGLLTKELMKTPVVGFSPTSSPTPIQPSIDVIKLDEEVSSDEGSDDEECDVTIVVYRKNNYYLDAENKVYKIEEDDSMGPCIGDWVKGNTGKFKLD